MNVQISNDFDDLARALYPHVFGGQMVSLLRLPVPNRGQRAGPLHAPPRARA